MILTEQNLSHYLFQKNLLSPLEVVSGDLMIETADFRNRNFKIRTGEGRPNLFVKQVKSTEPDRIDTLRRESCIYWLAEHFEQLGPLLKYLPPLHHYDYQNHILVVSLLDGYRNLYDLHAMSKQYVIATAELQAACLAAMHLPIAELIRNKTLPNYFRFAVPWPFQLNEDAAEAFVPEYAADRKMLDIVRGDRILSTQIRELYSVWEQKTLIHGDVKWLNFLVNNDCSDIKLIDWEMTEIGDPCWDIAGVVHNYLFFWLLKQDAVRRKSGSIFDDSRLSEAVNLFLKTYFKLRQTPEEEQNDFLVKSLRYTALRLIQAAFEGVHHGNDLNETALRLLQLGQNILAEPNAAIQELLQIRL